MLGYHGLNFGLTAFTMLVSHPTVPKRKLTYVSPKPGLGEALFGILVAAGLVSVLGNSVMGTLVTPGGTAGSVIVLLFFAILFLLAVTRRRIVEFDLVDRKLTITQSWFGPPNKLILDCPLDQCRALGRIGYETDGHASYGVYVELLSGRRYDIPVNEKTIQEAGRVAARLSDASGIPRLDI